MTATIAYINLIMIGFVGPVILFESIFRRLEKKIA